MEPVSPNLSISITLEAQEWNTVLEVLAGGPYRLVSQIIQKLATQAQGAASAAETTAENHAQHQLAPRSNGAALGGDI